MKDWPEETGWQRVGKRVEVVLFMFLAAIGADKALERWKARRIAACQTRNKTADAVKP